MQTRTRVKICGITRECDARAAVQLGVDAIGMILHADSPRLIDVDQAQMIREEIPALVSLVGVFVDCPSDTVNEIASAVGLDLVQLHGNESNRFGASLNTPFIKAIRAKSIEQVQFEVGNYPDARALLLDPFVVGQHGGTGQSLDTALWPQTEQPLILAGGLSPTNVGNKVAELAPFAVDLNSGVEAAPGVKDLEKMTSALRAVHG